MITFIVVWSESTRVPLNIEADRILSHFSKLHWGKINCNPTCSIHRFSDLDNDLFMSVIKGWPVSEVIKLKSFEYVCVPLSRMFLLSLLSTNIEGCIQYGDNVPPSPVLSTCIKGCIPRLFSPCIMISKLWSFFSLQPKPSLEIHFW
mgnify:CR=1 FL=1